MKLGKKKTILFILLIWLISLCIYIPYLMGHYATDTYNIENRGYEEYATVNSLNDGRIIMYFIGRIAGFLQIPIQAYVIGLTVLAILISSISVLVVFKMIMQIKPTKKKEIALLVGISCYLTIFHFMFLENFYFVEAAVMALSVLCYILSTKQILSKGKYALWKAAGLAILATFCYQGTIAFYVVFGAVFFILKDRENPKEILKNMIILVSFCLIAFLLNVVQIKIVGSILDMEQKRMVTGDSLWKTTQRVFRLWDIVVWKVVWLYSCYLFPDYLMMFFLGIITILVSIQTAKQKKLNIFVYFIGIIGVTLIASTAISIVSFGSYDTGRIHTEVGALLGLTLLFLYGISREEKNKGYIAFLGMTIMGMLGISVFHQIQLQLEHRKVNELEIQAAQKVEDYILEYEQKYGIEVTQIAGIKVYSKGYSFYPEVRNRSVLTYDGLRCSWSYVGAINHVTGRKLKEKDVSEKERENFLEVFGSIPDRDAML